VGAAAATVASGAFKEFNFSDDKNGFGCPYGAHIRRMNPRTDPVVPFIRRPLLRRGKPYTRYGADGKSVECGLLGLFLCASLEEQFEHVLGAWASNLPMGMGAELPGKDPIIGSHDAYGGTFTIPVKDDKPRLLPGLAPFVVTRGTAYVFFPGTPALTGIANGSAGRREHSSRPAA
jgi:deferrochelatase/peroxidase EfeB